MTCDWCGRAIRYVSLMKHPDWPDSVRVGRVCAMCMSRRWKFPSPSVAKDFLQRELGVFRRDVWAYVFWVLILVVAVLLLSPDRFNDFWR